MLAVDPDPPPCRLNRPRRRHRGSAAPRDRARGPRRGRADPAGRAAARDAGDGDAGRPCRIDHAHRGRPQGHALRPQEPGLRGRRPAAPLLERAPGRRPLAGAGRLGPALPGPAPAQEGGVARRAAHAARRQRLRPPHHRAHGRQRQHRARRARGQREGAVPRGPGAGPGDGGDPARRRRRRASSSRSASPAASSTSVQFVGGKDNVFTITLGRRFKELQAHEEETPSRLVLEFLATPLAAGEPTPAPSAAASAAPRLPVPEGPAVRTVVIDPGHGGDDVGAKGPGGTLEKDVTLAIARKVRAAVANQLGLQAFLTRDKDQDVAARRARRLRQQLQVRPVHLHPRQREPRPGRARAARSTSCPTRPATTRAGAWPRWKAGRCRPGPAHRPAPTWR